MSTGTAHKPAPRMSRVWEESPPPLREAVERLIESKRLTRREAGNVLSLDVPLEKLLVRKEVRRVLKNGHSCLVDAKKAREAIAIHLFQTGKIVGSILGVSKYLIAFKPSSINGKATPGFKIDKARIKYAYHPALDSAISACRTSNSQVKSMGLSVPAKVKDRFHLRSEDLQRYLRDSTPLRFTIFDGDVLQGIIRWWSQYEIGIDVAEGVALTLFRHAILGVSEANGAASYRWRRLVEGEAAVEDVEEDQEGSEYDPTEDMTLAQAEVWRTIENLGRPWTITEIVGKCGRSQVSVNNAVNLFVEAEMVREASRQGRRRYFIVEPVPVGDED